MLDILVLILFVELVVALKPHLAPKSRNKTEKNVNFKIQKFVSFNPNLGFY